jgi:polygalacturonase
MALGLAGLNVRPGGARAAPGAAGAGLVFDVRRFGADHTGKTPSTRAIQKAIDACAAARGGTVVIPPGHYLTGALFLCSNLHLAFAPGATLLASQRFDDYPLIDGRWEGIERKTYASLLTGRNLENVRISGAGLLDGQGSPWWEAHATTRLMRLKQGLPREAPEPPGAPLPYPRPRMINLIRCQNVALEGITLLNSPSWTIHLIYCQDVLVHGVNMTGVQAQDCCGVVVDSSKSVRVVACSIASGADCIGIKSGYNEDGRRVGLPSEDVVVASCHLSLSYASAVAIGSETAGGIKNVTVDNCVISRCNNGISLRSARGRGGIIERVRCSNLVMDQLQATAFSMVLFFDSAGQGMSYGNEPPSRTRRLENDPTRVPPPGEATPTLRDIELANLTIAEVPNVGRVEGLPERYIQGLNLTNITARKAGGGIVASRISDFSVAGLNVTPTDRPALSATHIQRLELTRLRTGARKARTPLVELEHVMGGFIHGCDVSAAGDRFVVLKGEDNQNVALANNRNATP